MFNLLIRLIPYLYYFVREAYRRDMNEEMTRKKRARYRTYVAVLLSLILLGTIFSVWKMNKMRVEVGLCLVDATELRKQAVSYTTDYVKRDTYDDTVNAMSHKIASLEVYTDLMAAKLHDLCDKDPKGCGSTTRTLLERLDRQKADTAREETKEDEQEMSPVTVEVVPALKN